MDQVDSVQKLVVGVGDEVSSNLVMLRNCKCTVKCQMFDKSAGIKYARYVSSIFIRGKMSVTLSLSVFIIPFIGSSIQFNHHVRSGFGSGKWRDSYEGEDGGTGEGKDDKLFPLSSPLIVFCSPPLPSRCTEERVRDLGRRPRYPVKVLGLVFRAIYTGVWRAEVGGSGRLRTSMCLLPDNREERSGKGGEEFVV